MNIPLVKLKIRSGGFWNIQKISWYPPEGPLDPDEPGAAGFEELREPLRKRRGFEWVAEMFRRHRRPARAGAAA